ncbi:hypothetical protein I8752_21590 [Nostocaceae cyanobacterium CENA369]|uniref:Uncharacterized protein n=1 Tax=Dendronalium phyllosphericum CENA369 TaxID=1725256 RepID=A0A8J7I7A6_9NOST|nr:hypothetical protein [Dendronalium phyllosphericum]MBH8575553.1 hypothetical protein [Dendronalium phyllosphericum CENA369]
MRNKDSFAHKGEPLRWTGFPAYSKWHRGFKPYFGASSSPYTLHPTPYTRPEGAWSKGGKTSIFPFSLSPLYRTL